jgi:hypothetical protein
VGQQEVHEYEALSGCPGGCLYCWLILFCQSLQTFLRIILDITLACTVFRACLISQRVRIGEIDFLPCKAKSRSNPDGLQGFLTQSGRKIYLAKAGAGRC